MADFTASTGLRDLIGTFLDGCYYWITLHDSTGGFVASDTYTAGIRGELATSATTGYTRGAKTLDLANTNGVLTASPVVWTAGSEQMGPATYAAVWGSATNSITGAKLICVEHPATPQTATAGQTMTVTIGNVITIPTPA